MNDKNVGLRVAGTVFGVVGAVHLLRLLTGFELIVAGRFVPVWVNGVASIVAAGLAVWLLGLSR